MQKLFFDIDGVVRDLEHAVFGRRCEKWEETVDGRMSFVEYVCKNSHVLMKAGPAKFYHDVRMVCDLFGPESVTFLSSQHEEWLNYTDAWLQLHFPGCRKIYVSSPEQKLILLEQVNGILLDDYPSFSDYSRVVLVDHVYNREVDKSVTRVREPGDIVNFVFRYYGKTLIPLANACHKIAVSRGWWDDPRPDSECIALMHSELSEVLEELRQPEINRVAVAEELVDCVIRIFDFAQKHGYDLGYAFADKAQKNMNRPYRHGKRF